VADARRAGSAAATGAEQAQLIGWLRNLAAQPEPVPLESQYSQPGETCARASQYRVRYSPLPDDLLGPAARGAMTKARDAQWKARVATRGTRAAFHGTTLPMAHSIVNNGLNAEQRKALSHSWEEAKTHSGRAVTSAHAANNDRCGDSDGTAAILWQHAYLGEIASCVAICELPRSGDHEAREEQEKELREEDVRVVGVLLWDSPKPHAKTRNATACAALIFFLVCVGWACGLVLSKGRSTRSEL